MKSIQAICLHLLFFLGTYLSAQAQCTVAINAPLTGGSRYCYRSIGRFSAADQTLGNQYTWSITGGATIVQNYGSAVDVYFGSPCTTFTLTLQQICINGNMGSSVTTWNSAITCTSPTPGMTITGPDTVVAGVPSNFNLGFNSTVGLIIPNATVEIGLRQLNPIPGICTDLIPLSTTGFNNIVVPQTFANPGINQKLVLSERGYLDQCADSTLKNIFVVGTITGPTNGCLGTTATYSILGTTARTWSVVGGTILSGQGTPTIQVQWNTVGNDSVICNWDRGTLTHQISKLPVTVGTIGAPVITGSPTLCSPTQTYSVVPTPGHTYRWKANGVLRSTTSSLNLTAGNVAVYNLVLYDSIGSCGTTASLAVTNAVYPHPNINPVPGCSGTNTTMSISPIVGATYTWSAGAGGSIVAGAGTNAVTVTYPTGGNRNPTVTVDVGGCQRTIMDTMTIYPTVFPNLGPNITSCSTLPTTLTNANYNSSFSYSYTNSTGFGGMTMNTSGPGTYWMQTSTGYPTATCVGRDTVILATSTFPLTVNLGVDTIVCTANSTTIAAPGVTGATPPFNYLWSNGSTASSITVTSNGTYSVTVSKAGYCDGVDSKLVTFHRPYVNLPVSSLFCPGGSVTLNAGSGFVGYQWSTGATTSSISVNTPSTYRVTTTDNLGCVSSDSILVAYRPILVPNLGADTAVCNTSSLSLSPTVTGGPAPYTYAWSTGGGNVASINVTTSGTYTVTVSKTAHCPGTDSKVVAFGPALSAGLPPTSGFCAGSSVTLQATLGLSSYIWSNGATTSSITVNTPGTYSVTVTNSTGCVGSGSTVVSMWAAPPLILGADTMLCPGATLPLQAVASASYAWSTGSTSQTILVNAPGTYDITITDVHGCQWTDNLAVSAGTLLQPNLGADTLVCTASSFVLSPTVTGGPGPYTYSWSSGATTSTINATVSGSYAVTVSESGYCDGQDTVLVTFATMPPVSLPSSQQICPGASATLNAGSGYSTYAWSTGATASSILVSSAGTYDVTATDNVGCASTAAGSVSHFPAPSLILGADTAICPDTFAVLTSAAFASYLWNTSATTQSIQTNTAGTYSVTVVDGNGCTWQDNLVLGLNTDCIWPGDANHDGIANNADMLSIGYALTSTGPARVNASTSWYGQVCNDWGQIFPSLLNYKHADCDGDGTIANADTMVVIQNYGLTHNKVGDAHSGPALQFIPLQASYVVGDTVAIAIHLGDAATQAIGTNGLAYSVVCGGIATQPGDAWFSFPNSFLGNAGNDMLAVALEDVAPSQHDVAQSRIGASPVSGFGQIAILYIRTDSTLLPNAQNLLSFTASSALLVDGQLNPMPITSISGSVHVNASSTNATSPSHSDQLKVSPNPADQHLNVEWLGIGNLNLTLTDLSGKIVLQTNSAAAITELNVTELSSGTYILSAHQDQEVISRVKVSVLH